MVQTTPAAALLGVASGGKGVDNSAKSGNDDGGFSREFEEVSRGSEPQREAPASTSTQSGEHRPEAGSATESEERVEQETPAADEVEQEEAAAGGKHLPLVAEIDDAEETTESGESVAVDVAENTQGLIPAIVQQDEKQALTPGTEAKQHVGLSAAATATEAGKDSDEALSFSSLRLRDLNPANLQNAGDSGGEQAMARQGKSDSVLFTLVNGSNGSQTNFSEMLNSSAAGIAAASTTTQQSSPTLPAQMTLSVPLQQSGWDQAMGERVVWLARNNVQQAQIQLNPRELGPIEIKISVQNDQTHVNFVAHHATTRDAIEAALPRLREMLGEQGLNLGQADVSQHSFGDNQRQAAVADQERGFGNAPHGELEHDETDSEVTLHSGRISSSAVDFFA